MPAVDVEVQLKRLIDLRDVSHIGAAGERSVIRRRAFVRKYQGHVEHRLIVGNQMKELPRFFGSVHVLYGELDFLVRHTVHDSNVIVERNSGGDYYVCDGRQRYEGHELRGGVELRLPKHSADTSADRLLREERRLYVADMRTMRQRIRGLLDDWPAPYEQALRQRQEQAADVAAHAREAFDSQVDRQRRELLDRLVVAVNDGLDIGEAAKIGKVDRDELEAAVRLAKPQLLSLENDQPEIDYSLT